MQTTLLLSEVGDEFAAGKQHPAEQWLKVKYVTVDLTNRSQLERQNAIYAGTGACWLCGDLRLALW